MKSFKFLSVLFLLAILFGGCGKTPYDVIGSISNLDDVSGFLKHDFIDLSVIEKISKFRSGAGHDYSDGFTTNCSMKHYYNAYKEYLGDDHTVRVYSPVDGVVTDKWEEGEGRANDWQLLVIPKHYAYVTIVLFHVNTALKKGDKVAAGQLIGYVCSTPILHDAQQGATYSPSFDIGVWILTRQGVQYISYFDIMSDSLFATYQARGVTSRSEMIISKDWRDAHPVDWENPSENDWVTLTAP